MIEGFQTTPGPAFNQDLVLTVTGITMEILCILIKHNGIVISILALIIIIVLKTIAKEEWASLV